MGQRSLAKVFFAARTESPECMVCDHPPISPVRGLIPLHNARGQYFRVTEVHRWLNYLARVQRVTQIDVLAHGSIPPSAFPMVEYAVNQGVGTSFRTNCTAGPDGFTKLAWKGFESLLLTPLTLDSTHFEAWLKAGAEIGCPIRVQLTGAVAIGEPDTLAAQWHAAGVRHVSFLPRDPLLPDTARTTPTDAADHLEALNLFAIRLREAGIAVAFHCFPKNALHPENWPHAADAVSTFLDHQQYRRYPYELAQYLFQQHPHLVRLYILLKLADLSHREDPVDRLLLRLLVAYPHLLYRPVFLVSKAFRARHAGLSLVDPVETEDPALRAAEHAAFNEVFPGKGAPPAAPLPPMGRTGPSFFDRTNFGRLQAMQAQQANAQDALQWLRDTPPDLDSEVLATPQKSMFTVMAGAQQWYSAESGERISFGLPTVETPFMISVTFGGGVAELIGFRLNRTLAILCPMVAPAHTLVLYVDAVGRYVLLRDGQAVSPVEVEGKTVLPGRFPNALQLFLSVWNIHDTLSVTPIKIWSGAPLYSERKEGIRFSIVMFCTNFSRRLQSALLSIAHQRDFPLDQLEVIVAYVPGIDFTEDVIESVRAVFPQLRFIHAPLGAQNERSKGYALNEAMRMTSGDWIMLMDADILLPPDFFVQVSPHTEEHVYLAPIGRGLLGRGATARVLLGQLTPWDDWEALWEGVEEVRDQEAMGVPIGFSQLFRRECVEKVQYQEYEHFQGADWEFGKAMRDQFGVEQRLPIRVLHLDHGGSQWYGVQRQY